MKLALRFLQLGAIAVVIAAATTRGFELDRFLVPKELALHLSAFVAAAFAFRVARRGALTGIDLALLLYLLLSAVSAAMATNVWLAFRALAISASAVALYWTARALRVGLARPLINGLAVAVVVATATSLLQTYGVWIDLFTESRAPGGTLGNRNFVAHVAAFGLPIVLLVALRAQRVIGYLFASLGTAIVTASLVLTRSRAGWLAAAAVAVVILFALIASPPLRRDARTWRRLFGAVALACSAVVGALLIPNELRWRSENPYLESVRDVANYEEGSGRGRLIQYERSLRLAARHPLLGVGPGNWPVEYPRHAPRNDPSMDTSEGGVTFNPWPSSDWVAFASERGFAAALLLLFAFAVLAFGAMKRLFTAVDFEQGAEAMALLGTLAAAAIAGAFDAVLLQALPTFLVWTTIGVLLPTPPAVVEAQRSALRTAALATILLVVLIGASRSTAQLVAMQIYATQSDRTSLARAARIDPGNYRVHLRLARSGRRQQRCEHALAAHALFPAADAAEGLSRGCGER